MFPSLAHPFKKKLLSALIVGLQAPISPLALVSHEALDRLLGPFVIQGRSCGIEEPPQA